MCRPRQHRSNYSTAQRGKAPDDLSAWRASNVGVCGSLADGYPVLRHFGGKLLLVAAVRRDPAGSLLLLRGAWHMRDPASLAGTCDVADRPVGNSVGAIG